MNESNFVIPTTRACGIRSVSASDPVDLVIVIDTSPSMRDEAVGLSQAAAAAIEIAESSCPANLRVTWLGIEGTWKGTNFNRTVRDYLTQELQVPESQLRGRKLGEVKKHGAQEDGARMVEDVVTYFDWREDAAKAIFYLGDETLEGGGLYVTKQDIQAANLAINKAKAAGVIVHTYFGKTKSQKPKTIEQEYARLATETGGQAFTYGDRISGFERVLEKVICQSRPIFCQLNMLRPLPCFELGLSNQSLSSNGSETVYIKAVNCYSNLVFRDLTITLSAMLKRDGTELPKSQVKIDPSSQITFGDLPASEANNPEPSEIVRQVTVETQGITNGDYWFDINYSFKVEFPLQGRDEFSVQG